ncbi:MAG: ABC transporter ATP-binding protein [Propionibacteriaceae bacterium]|nr:ABC transporter ATP-binding protein [Propionibacteriaceae bacterium]
MSVPLLVAEGLEVTFGDRKVLAGASLQIGPGERLAIRGTSGSGKTTLLRVLAGIQVPDAGRLLFDGEVLSDLSDDKRSRLRLREFGFVFQFADLVPELTVSENIALPLEFLGVRRPERNKRVRELIAAMELQKCCDQLPHSVSGGERQRAAVARAVIHRPRLLFADEPTGSLDTYSRDGALSVLSHVVRQFGCALILVTHDSYVAHTCERAVEMIDGCVMSANRLNPWLPD